MSKESPIHEFVKILTSCLFDSFLDWSNTLEAYTGQTKEQTDKYICLNSNLDTKMGHFWVKTSQREQRKFDPWVWQNINFVSVWQFPFLLLSIIGVTELLQKSFYISLAVRVSVQGVESLWGDCRFILADWGL